MSTSEAMIVREKESNAAVHLVAMPCSSKVDVPHILNILSQGAERVLVVACPEGACQFLVGNVRAEKRIRYVQQLLQSAGLSHKSVGLLRGDHLDAQAIVDAIAVLTRNGSELRSLP